MAWWWEYTHVEAERKSEEPLPELRCKERAKRRRAPGGIFGGIGRVCVWELPDSGIHDSQLRQL